LPVRPERETGPLSAADVLLVTGGGKGITAECAMAMAGEAKLIVLGRSDPGDDQELAANLRRMTESGLTVHYAMADVTDAGQVRQAVAAAQEALGPVTAVLHGAGRNEPGGLDRKSTRLNSSHVKISYAVFCLKKKNKESRT